MLVLAACAGDDEEDDAGAPGTTTRAPEDAARPDPPVPSPGCDTGRLGAVREELRGVEAGGTGRWFLLTAPEAAGDDPLPLVLDIHGLAEGAQVATTMSRFSDLAQREGFLVAFPHGTGSPVRWNTDLDEANPDIAYMEALLDAVGQERCVDESRIYAAGLSMGGMMSSTLACTMSERFAAVAPVAGVQMREGCDPPEPVPVLAFHGTADPIVLFNGGLGDALGRILSGATGGPTTTLPPPDLDGEGYPAAAAAWAAHDGCEDAPEDTEVSDEVTRRVYRCPAGTAVEFVIINGGGHSWPGSEFSRSIESVVGHTTFDIDATAEIWRFFQRFQRR